MGDRILWGVGTSRTIRAHWALIWLGLEYEVRPIRTRTPDMDDPAFQALNPKGKIPTLQDGDLTLTESPAIVTYLAERYSTPERRLIPEDVAERAAYFEALAFIAMELDATSMYVLRRHMDLPHIYGEAEAANDAARGYFARAIDAAAIRMQDGRRFMLGDDFSGADILMSSCINTATRYHLHVPDAFQAYQERVQALPETQAALKANTPS